MGEGGGVLFHAGVPGTTMAEDSRMEIGAANPTCVTYI